MSHRLILQQACDQSLEPPPTTWELTVSCSISIPDEGSFHPSLTGSMVGLRPLDAKGVLGVIS
ncbi:hypothetical protein JHK87_024958 [Glycine soja]|nr:hypothetical protein JHK87_024958 [Glycine soja]